MVSRDSDTQTRQSAGKPHQAGKPRRASTPKKVVIIGGGIIGIAAAHFLRLDGHDVTIVDKNTIGGGCSHGACGFVSPSHVLPLAEPGTIRDTLRTVWRSNSPLRIKPRLNTALIRWLWNFSRRCNEADMLDAAGAIHPLLIRSRDLYRELLDPNSPDGAMECSWQRRGLLFVYRDHEALERYRPTNDLLTSQFNEPARCIAGTELREFEPALRHDVAGAWFFEDDAHFRPDQLITSWSDRLRQQGVTFIENAMLERMQSRDGVVSGVTMRTADGERRIDGDTFVIATGAWTPMLAGLLGYQIPIQPGKGYSMTFDMPATTADAPNPTTPMIFPQHRVAVTPMGDRLRLGSIMEFAGYDDSIRPNRLRLLTDGAGEYLNHPPTTEVLERWQGWRPMTYDSTPVIDVCPGFKNVVLAAGHNMLGLSMAPGTGEMLSQMIGGQPTELDASRYRADRFSK